MESRSALVAICSCCEEWMAASSNSSTDFTFSCLNAAAVNGEPLHQDNGELEK